MKKVSITTLGCKVNQYESAAFKTGFAKCGMAVVTRTAEAAMVVINTCALTASAAAQSRHTNRPALRRNRPSSRDLTAAVNACSLDYLFAVPSRGLTSGSTACKRASRQKAMSRSSTPVHLPASTGFFRDDSVVAIAMWLLRYHAFAGATFFFGDSSASWFAKISPVWSRNSPNSICPLSTWSSVARCAR